MKGVAILMHAIGMVTSNLGAALRISGALMAVQFVLALVLDAQFFYLGSDMNADMATMMRHGQGQAGTIALLAIVQAVATLWIAVAWHRYILREETPQGVMPRFNGGAILSYIWAGIVFAVILIIVSIPLGLLVGLIVMPFAMGGGMGGMLLAGLIGFLALWIPVAYVSFRISPILPAAALQQRLPLGEAWYATGTSGAAFVVLAVSSVVAVWVINLPVVALERVSGFLAFVWAFGAQWVALMVGVSILTTIYGHYVEKRSLND